MPPRPSKPAVSSPKAAAAPTPPKARAAKTKPATKKPVAPATVEAIPASPVHVGIGGWTFEPWRGVFYPPGLPHAKELGFAASRLTAIEVNGTFYRTQTPATFRKWASEVPNGFVFSLKGPRYVTNRRDLAGAGESIDRFLDSGVTELGDRLGPLLWQFPPTRKFDEAEFGGFLELLPREFHGRRLRHAVEVRHDSFRVPAFVRLARRFETAIVFSEHNTYPAIADVTADFVYLRLQKGDDQVPTCYPEAGISAWAERVRGWLAGRPPSDLPRVDTAPGKTVPRDVFVYFIHEGKVRAPAGAMALIETLRS